MINPYYYNHGFDWATFWTAFGVIVALLLGLAGIFQDWIRSKFWKPKLKISMNVAPPDCHKTSFYRTDIDRKISDTYYLRFRVENTGNNAAEDVEALITELYKKEGAAYSRIKSFLPLNLVWSHYGQITMPKIQPKLFKHLDFGHILKSESEYLSRFGIQETSAIFFEFEVAVKPNTGSHILLSGDYKAKVVFAGNNLEPVTKLYHLVIQDHWSDDENTMLTQNVSVKEVAT